MQEVYGTKLIASNDYLLGDNPYFTFIKTNPDYVTVKCRPSKSISKSKLITHKLNYS